MNNDIKEIKVIKSNHSYMIEYKNGGKFTQYGVEEDLLDYITNLQQKIDKALDLTHYLLDNNETDSNEYDIASQYYDILKGEDNE